MAASAFSSHRPTSNLRHALAQSSLEGIPQSPHTPVRQTSQTLSSYSPSTRNEDDCTIFEFGTRYMRAGFANDQDPRCVIRFGPDEQRRAGDYSQWLPAYQNNWRARKGSLPWGESHELWRMDLRNVDLGLVEDKIDRAVRECYAKYLLTDSKSRRLLLALPSGFPHALLSSLLMTLFNSLQCPSISIMSTPMLSTVAAGLRSGLVVDIGWSETTVTGVYEYREVKCLRSVKATKTIVHETARLLAQHYNKATGGGHAASIRTEEDDYCDVVSFEETEDVMLRTGWCRSRERSLSGDAAGEEKKIKIRLRSTPSPVTIDISFSALSNPTETAMFDHGTTEIDRPDDHELPIDKLVYKSLLQLPEDVRAICMARIVFVGGGSNIPGIKMRVLDEVKALVQRYGWNPVRGRAADQHTAKSRALAERKDANAPTVKQSIPEEGENAAFAAQEPDEIMEKLQLDDSKGSKQRAQGAIRGCESLGAWTGASLVTSLKLKGIVEVERDRFLAHGLTGASKEMEVGALPASSRLSMVGPSATRAGGAGDRTSWTMGAWA